MSPDGQWLALANQGDIKEDLFVMKVDGTGLRRVTEDAARDRQPRWAPDGKSIVFYSNREGGHYLPYLDSSGRKRAHQNGAAGEQGPVLRGDFSSGRLAGHERRRVHDVFVSPPFPSKESQMRPLKNLEVEGGAIQASGWSPDGRYLSGAIISKTSSPR